MSTREAVLNRLLDEMERFGEGAWEYSKFPKGKGKPKLQDRHIKQLDYESIRNEIDLFDFEYLRSLDYKDDRYLFALDIETPKHKGEWLDAIMDTIWVARELERTFPASLEFHLSGNGVHACAEIDLKDRRFLKDYKVSDAKAIYHYCAMVCEGIGEILTQRMKDQQRDLDIDKYFCRKIYSQGRIFKLPGSINFSASEKAGTEIFCVPFLPSQTVEEILEISQLRREPSSGISLPKFNLFGISKPLKWKKGRGTPKNIDYDKIKVPKGLHFKIEGWPPCILSEFNVPEPSHYWRVAVVKFLYSIGYSVEEICGFFKSLSPKDYNERKTKYQVNYDYGKIMSGCQTLQIVYGICPGECGRVHPLDRLRRKKSA